MKVGIVKALIGIAVALGLSIGAASCSNNNGQELATYDKCLYEPYPNGHDCQTIFHDCANGDSYACHLEHVLGCLEEYGAGCPNDTGNS